MICAPVSGRSIHRMRKRQGKVGKSLAFIMSRQVSHAFIRIAVQQIERKKTSLISLLQDVGHGHVQLLLVGVGKGALEQLHHGFLGRVPVLHLQVQAGLPDVELLTLLPAAPGFSGDSLRIKAPDPFRKYRK